MVGPIDMILIAVRWVHALAGAVWLGGGLFYLLVLQPSLAIIEDQSPLESLKASINKEFKEIVQLGMMGLAVTGAILALERLSQGNVSNLYVAILVLKVAAAGTMFHLARSLGRKKLRFARTAATVENDEVVSSWPSFLKGIVSPSQIILVLGVIVFLLASTLQVVFEKKI